MARKRLLILVGLILVVVLAVVMVARARPSAADMLRSAVLSELQNRVETRADAGDEWAPAADAQEVYSGAQVQTYAESGARLDFDDQRIIRLAELTLFTLAEPDVIVQGAIPRLILESGRLFVVLTGELDREVTVETSVGVAAVRGSIMAVTYNRGQGALNVGCLTGHCAIRNAQGETELTAGEEAEIAAPDQLPSPPQPLSAENIAALETIPEAIPLLPTATPSPPPTATPSATPPTGAHVTLPPVPCSTGRECVELCGVEPGTPEPEACAQAEEALVAQGVNMDAFVACLIADGDLQACADQSVER